MYICITISCFNRFCLDLVENSTSEYKLVRLPEDVPIVNSYQCCKYNMLLNAEHKITKVCVLLKVIMGDTLLAKHKY